MRGGGVLRAMDHRDLTVDFQPIVDLGSGRVMAVEAMPGLRDPSRAGTDSRRLLATARAVLDASFADAVLETALAAAAQWSSGGLDLPVALNVSPRRLLDPLFPGRVKARLRDRDVAADRLYLEVTERLPISQIATIDQALGQLRTDGVRVTLNQFGTGPAPLTVLARIPVHQLKVDPSFVSAVETSPPAAAVIRAAIELARTFKLTVVAPDVESESQRHTLWELGCDGGQGSMFGRPLPASRLLTTLRRRQEGRTAVFAPGLHAYPRRLRHNR